jgi:hypothetical protein
MQLERHVSRPERERGQAPQREEALDSNRWVMRGRFSEQITEAAEK